MFGGLIVVERYLGFVVSRSVNERVFFLFYGKMVLFVTT